MYGPVQDNFNLNTIQMCVFEFQKQTAETASWLGTYLPFQRGTVFIRQILTYKVDKVDPRTERVKIFIMAVDP